MIVSLFISHGYFKVAKYKLMLGLDQPNEKKIYNKKYHLIVPKAGLEPAQG